MSYQLSYSAQANKDIDFHKKSGNKPILKKLLVLFEELTEHPTHWYRQTRTLPATGLEGSTMNIDSFIKFQTIL